MDSLLANMDNVTLLVIMALWVLPWKGVALWKAARLSHKGWFIVLFIVNSMAILDIIYIYFIASKYRVESVEAEQPEAQPGPSGEN